MNYELAKQLKDAGFPQNLPRIYRDGHHDVPVTSCSLYLIFYPTLSELIEACGDKFGGLVLNDKKFKAYASQDSWVDMAKLDFPSYKDFATPEEAVATLWLALNNK